MERYLKECVSSVQRQTFKNWEMILVDDGSTDSTLSLCMELASKDERIIVFHQNNAGVSAARNKGLELSKGQWIIFIDSDDWFSDNAFDTFLKAIDEVKCDRYIFNRSSAVSYTHLPIPNLFIWGDERNYDQRAKDAGFIPHTVVKAIHNHPSDKLTFGESLFGKKIVLVPNK